MARPFARPGVPPRPPRTAPPVQLPGATRFSEEDAAFFDPVRLVRFIQQAKSVAPVRRALAEAKVSHGHGPRRADGDWALAFLAFVVSREPNVQPWYRTAATNAALWRECGFTSVPAYQTVWQRFAELEQFPDVFARASHHLIDIARRRDPRIGMHLAVDGTESQTHAQPAHACPPGVDCPTRDHQRGPRLPRVGVEEAIALRQHEAIVEEPEEENTSTHTPTPGLEPVPENYTEVAPDGLLFTSCGHYWLSRDASAGTRKYKGGKVWHGYISNKAVDSATGLTVAVLYTPASVNESVAFPDLYEMTREAVGTDPIAIITDRGYVTDAVARYCTERGVTQVAPYRKRNRNDPASATATDRVDQHGIPRCKHCGLSGDFVRFSEVGSPRVWFRCPLPTTAGCTKVQSIACSEEIRRLLPIWRTSPVYAALRAQMGVREHAHEDMRTYFRSGGKTLRDRQRRAGIACQQLRANAAILAQWLWALLRQGWLGSRPERAQLVELGDGGFLRRLIGARNRKGILGGSYPRRSRAGSAPPSAATAAP